MSGGLAGYAIWAVRPGGTPWAFGEDFLGTLFITGLFSGLLMGLIPALNCFGIERRPMKALQRFAAGAAVGLALSTIAAVLYSLAFDASGMTTLMPWVLRRALWWGVLAIALATSRGYLVEEIQAGCTALLGLFPGVVLAGLITDFTCFSSGWLLTGSLLLGSGTGLSLGLAVELLKVAWLEEGDGTWQRQYLLETEEFVAGSEDSFDFTFPEGISGGFTIVEQEGGHILESLDGEPVAVGSGRYRYRALVDGDIIRVGDECWVYHNRYGRVRDVLPEFSG